MRIDVLLKIAGVGLLAGVICQALNKAGREDMAALAGVAGTLVVLLTVVSLAGELLGQIQAVFHLP